MLWTRPIAWSPSHAHPSPGLPHAMDTPNSLELCAHIELGLHQQHVSGLHDVEALGPRLEQNEEDIDVRISLEGLEGSLEGSLGFDEAMLDVVLQQASGDVGKDLLPLVVQ